MPASKRLIRVTLSPGGTNMNQDELELVPGNPGKPLFGSEKKQYEFQESFMEQARVALKDLPKPLRWFPYQT